MHSTHVRTKSRSKLGKMLEFYKFHVIFKILSFNEVTYTFSQGVSYVHRAHVGIIQG